jgi:hypothetical protein
MGATVKANHEYHEWTNVTNKIEVTQLKRLGRRFSQINADKNRIYAVRILSSPSGRIEGCETPKKN